MGWTANVGGNQTLLPDFQGGSTVASAGVSVQKLDGMTGQAYPAYNYTNPYPVSWTGNFYDSPSSVNQIEVPPFAYQSQM